jgi:tetratricopeptide (TPR) repeat protein
VQTASTEIDAHQADIALRAATALASFDEAGRTLLEMSKVTAPGSTDQTINEQAAKAIRAVSDALKSKPESSFTADDHYARGLDFFSSNNYQSALVAFEKAIELTNAHVPPQRAAQFYVAKAVTQGRLNKPLDEIATYDAIDERFGGDTAPAVREQVLKGLFGKVVSISKRDKLFEMIATYDAIDQRFGNDTTPAVRELAAAALVNNGLTLGKLKRPLEAIAAYDAVEQRFGDNTDPAVRAQVAKGLFVKGATQSLLGMTFEGIANYDAIDQRFGNDSTPAVREHVANGFVGAGFSRVILGKQSWLDTNLRDDFLDAAITGLNRGLQLSAVNQTRAVLLGNLGYCQFLRGDIKLATELSTEYLNLGGESSLEAQRANAKQHRVEPSDAQYEALLLKVWPELHP